MKGKFHLGNASEDGCTYYCLTFFWLYKNGDDPKSMKTCYNTDDLMKRLQKYNLKAEKHSGKYLIKKEDYNVVKSKTNY